MKESDRVVMPRYVKGQSETGRLIDQVDNLQHRLKVNNQRLKRNTAELEKINQEVEKNRTDKITELENHIKKLETEINWVESSEPAVKLEPDHMLKKLNIL